MVLNMLTGYDAIYRTQCYARDSLVPNTVNLTPDDPIPKPHSDTYSAPPHLSPYNPSQSTFRYSS